MKERRIIRPEAIPAADVEPDRRQRTGAAVVIGASGGVGGAVARGPESARSTAARADSEPAADGQDEMRAKRTKPRWMVATLVAAGAYNLVWGLLVVAFPNHWFEAVDMAPPRYPAIWQCVGMIVGVYGVGYLIAASDPFRHWPIVLVGLLGKVLGPIGFLCAAVAGEVAWGLGLTIVTNDLIWWAPLGLILLAAGRRARPGGPEGPLLSAEPSLGSVIGETAMADGRTLAAWSHRAPVLLVLLRHLGCTFCRETLADVARRRTDLERQGTVIVLVHMGGDRRAGALLARYGLDDVARISDPRRRLYTACGLRRGRLGQLLGPRAWVRGVQATLRGHLPGLPAGDPRQMPGLVLLHRGRVVAAFRHASVADRPDFGARADACDLDLSPSSAAQAGVPPA